jgi:hypothetical protein
MNDAIDIELLRKVWTMAERGSPGEQVAARNRAEAIVIRHGKTLADIPALLRASDMPGIRLGREDDFRTEQRFQDIMRQERAKMTPEQRRASEEVAEHIRSGAAAANMRWHQMGEAQQKALVAMAQAGTCARRRKGTVFDLHAADGSVVKVRVAVESSLEAMLGWRLISRADRDTFWINDHGRQIVELGRKPAPRGPFETRSRAETFQGWKNVAAWCLANGRGFSDWEKGMLSQVAAAEAMPSSSRIGILCKLRQQVERQAFRQCPYHLDQHQAGAF